MSMGSSPPQGMTFREDHYEMLITENIYPEIVVLKALHAVSGSASGLVSRSGNDLQVTLFTRDEAISNQFLRLLNDYCLRQLLNERTKAYRRTVMAYLFSQTGLASDD